MWDPNGTQPSALPASLPYVHIHGDRGAALGRAVGRTRFRILSAVPHPARVPELGRVWVYELDLTDLNVDEMVLLIRYLAARFQVPRALVAAELEAKGMPIPIADTTLEEVPL